LAMATVAAGYCSTGPLPGSAEKRHSSVCSRRNCPRRPDLFFLNSTGVGTRTPPCPQHWPRSTSPRPRSRSQHEPSTDEARESTWKPNTSPQPIRGGLVPRGQAFEWPWIPTEGLRPIKRGPSSAAASDNWTSCEARSLIGDSLSQMYEEVGETEMFQTEAVVEDEPCWVETCMLQSDVETEMTVKAEVGGVDASAEKDQDKHELEAYQTIVQLLTNDRDSLDQRCQDTEAKLAECVEQLAAALSKLERSQAESSTLLAKMNECQERSRCVICLAEEADHIVLPCAHLALCSTCGAHAMDTCPVCRQCMQSVVQVYRP